MSQLNTTFKITLSSNVCFPSLTILRHLAKTLAWQVDCCRVILSLNKNNAETGITGDLSLKKITKSIMLTRSYN